MKRFDYGKYVSLSLCRISLENIYTIQDVKVFARVYEAEKYNDLGTNCYFHLELFAYNVLQPLKGDISGLYNKLKASKQFKELKT